MNADPVARVYRWLEYAAFGRTLERARFDFLGQAATARRVIIVGEGDGRFLARLLKCNPEANIAVVDCSARMIELARRRVRARDRERVQFHHLDAAAERLPDGPFDLAVTHFFFDIIETHEAESVIANLDARLTPQARWLLSEFQVPAGAARGIHARLWLRSMYGFFQATTKLRANRLSPYRELLACRGWRETASRERRLGMIRSQMWERRPE